VTALAKGDHVDAEALDGEISRAVVVRVLDKSAGETVLFEKDENERPVTVEEYWGGLVDADEDVVRVRFLYESDEEGGKWVAGRRAYDYPASQLTALDESGSESEVGT